MTMSPFIILFVRPEWHYFIVLQYTKYIYYYIELWYTYINEIYISRKCAPAVQRYNFVSFNFHHSSW